MSIFATAHSKYNINYHLVWCPKYRHSVLKGKIEEYFKKLLENIIGVLVSFCCLVKRRIC
jgi:REP element-mobilizing transposase RayT